MAEFTYNNAPSSTTGVSLFFANKGYYPKVQFQITGTSTPGPTNEYASKLEEIHTRLKHSIQAVQCRYQIAADRQCLPNPKIRVGDLVFILAKFIRTTQLSKKLAE